MFWLRISSGIRGGGCNFFALLGAIYSWMFANAALEGIPSSNVLSALCGLAGYVVTLLAAAYWLGGIRRRLDAAIKSAVERELRRASAAGWAAYSAMGYDEAVVELRPLRAKLLRLASKDERELIRGRARREIIREERDQERMLLAQVGSEVAEMGVSVAPEVADHLWISKIERQNEDKAMQDMNGLVRWALEDELAEDNGELEKERVVRFLEVAIKYIPVETGL